MSEPILLLANSPRVLWMDHRCWLGPLVHPLLRGVATPRDGRPARAIFRPSGLHFSCPLFLFIISLFSAYILPLFLCLISFSLFPCASVGKTLVPEFRISCCHTEWSLHFSRNELFLSLVKIRLTYP